MSWIEDPGVAYYNGFNISELGIDEAWINVTSLLTDTALWMYQLSSDCHKCPYQKVGAVNSSYEARHKISTRFPMRFRFRTKDGTYSDAEIDSSKFCDIDHDFGEFGVYNIVLNGTAKSPECKVETVLDPVNIYYPLLLAFLFYLIFGMLIFIATSSHSRLKTWCQSSRSTKTSSSTLENGSSPSSIESPPSSSTNANGTGNPGSHHPHNLTNRRLSSSSNGTTGTLLSSSNPNGNGYGHGHQSSAVSVTSHRHPNGNDIYAGSCTTEVAISTISSIPTSTTVTTYSNGKTSSSCADIANASIESPSTVPATVAVGSTLNRIPINPTISNGASNTNQSQSQPSTGARQPNKRLRSLDTFRGMCIVIMIFVNDGGAHYYFLEHATWDGLYIADLVFPWFLWIMGVCIPVSIKSQVKRGTSKFEILRRVFVRSCKLIGIGILLGSLWGPVDINTMRIPGVLQRFGVCYFICSTLVLFCMTVNITKPETSKLRAAMQDVQIIWISWLIVLLLVFVHCMLTFFLEVEGCPTGYLGPGGLHERNYPSRCIGGAAGYIDRKVFQTRHIYQWPTAKETYQSEAYDPEGMLGTLTSIFQVWLGVQTGVTMLVYPRASSRLKRWGAWAVITGATGALLCGCKQTGGWIPLNKNLWSLSFVLVTNCFALALLSALYFIIDIKRWWSGSPFFEPGMNSILLYVGHSVAHNMLPWHYVYGPMRTHFSRLIESLWGTTLWVLIAVYLNAKNKFWIV